MVFDHRVCRVSVLHPNEATEVHNCLLPKNFGSSGALLHGSAKTQLEMHLQYSLLFYASGLLQDRVPDSVEYFRSTYIISSRLQRA